VDKKSTTICDCEIANDTTAKTPTTIQRYFPNSSNLDSTFSIRCITAL
jgi:hypothetical protein